MITPDTFEILCKRATKDPTRQRMIAALYLAPHGHITRRRDACGIAHGITINELADSELRMMLFGGE